MKNPFGTDPLIAFFQGNWVWNGTQNIAFEVTSQYGCVVQGPQLAGISPGVPVSNLLITLPSWPQTAPGATQPNTTGVNDSTVLCQFSVFPALGGTPMNPALVNIGVTYGPVFPPTIPMQYANQILVDFDTILPGGPAFQMGLTNGSIYSCSDGSFTPESP